MLANIGLYTYLIAGFSFALLSILLMLQWRTRPLGPSLLGACLVTAAWAATIALGTLAEYPPVGWIQFTELLRNAGWLFFLLQLLGLQSDGTPWRLRGRAWPVYFLPLAAALMVLMLSPVLGFPLMAPATHRYFALILWLGTAVTGLLLIEQLFRNATESERWSVKYLCFSLGAIFAYDFFMYAEALLFRRLDAELWQARGLVDAIVTPWLAVAIGRNSNWRMDLQVSRKVVFHTVTLMGAGLYLLAMAVIGYFIKFMGGTWGGVLQVGFLAATGALLVSLLFSGKLRARLRVQLSKHFFSYRYDYREEWLKFTQALASLGEAVPEGIIRTMAPLASSPAGLLWGRSDNGQFYLLSHWQMPEPQSAGEGMGKLPQWLAQTDWVIDLDEWRASPDLYGNLDLPLWLQDHDALWLIIPLVFGEQLEGILMLKRSDLKDSINWEDRDLLKTAGRQAATHLAQYLASRALLEARQFDAFNRLSAYVVHDLKNILAQQSLIVSNAEKHRHNPEFIDDMIETVRNSVGRMQRLMEQMRSGERSAPEGVVDLCELIETVVTSRRESAPVPDARINAPDCLVRGDRERLGTVFNHLIQNAQEATARDGRVTVSLDSGDETVRVLIEDTGHGMDDEFVRNRLFRPFESTKGLTGMGIGTFESREYIRQLGGDIRVASEPGKGTVFTVTLPLAAAARSVEVKSA